MSSKLSSIPSNLAQIPPFTLSMIKTIVCLPSWQTSGNLQATAPNLSTCCLPAPITAFLELQSRLAGARVIPAHFLYSISWIYIILKYISLGMAYVLSTEAHIIRSCSFSNPISAATSGEPASGCLILPIGVPEYTTLLSRRKRISLSPQSWSVMSTNFPSRLSHTA